MEDKTKEKIKEYEDERCKLLKEIAEVLLLSIIVGIAIIILFIINAIFNNIPIMIIFSVIFLFGCLMFLYTNLRIDLLDKETLISNCYTIIKLLEYINKGDDGK